MMTYSEQTAVVTGGSGSIGGAIAMALAAQGAALALVGRNLARLEAIAENARSKATRAASYQTDLTIDENVQELKAALEHDFGFIDLLIHAAGVISLGLIESAPVEDLDWHYRINVRAPYYLTQALLPMLKARQGQIVFLNSLVGLNGKAGSSHYAASKHALKAVADSLRDEVNPYGLRVLSVFLGRTASPMQAEIHRIESKMYRPEQLLQPDDVASVVLNALALPRTAEVTDISIRHSIRTD